MEHRRDQKRPQEESDGFGSWNHNNHNTVRPLQALCSLVHLVASSSTFPASAPRGLCAVYAEAPAGPLGQTQAAQLRCAVPTRRPRRQEAKGQEQASWQTGVSLTAADITHPRTRHVTHSTNAAHCPHTSHATLAAVLFATSSVSSKSLTPTASTNLLQHRSRRPNRPFHPLCWFTTSTARSTPTQTCCHFQTRLTPWPDSRKSRALGISPQRKCVQFLSGPAHCSGARPRSKPSFLGQHAASDMPKSQARGHCQIPRCPIPRWKHLTAPAMMAIQLRRKLLQLRRKLLQAQCTCGDESWSQINREQAWMVVARVRGFAEAICHKTLCRFAGETWP